jgi:DNA-binding NarL/FixJ family response regulator
MIRILLADDHAAVRRALRCLLANEANWQVCAEAADGKEAVSLAALHRPDVAILDLVMPGLSGIEAARQIRGKVPECEIAMVTLHDSDELMRSAVAAGARAYLLKSDAEQHLVLAVRSLAEHRPYFPRGSGLASSAP